MSKTIEKQDLEGVMVYIVNALKNIGKTDFEGEGVRTYAHQWTKANIFKHNTEGMLHTENNPQYCGAPTPLGVDCSGLNAPMLSTN